jgi:hypothetical protein
MSSETTAIVVSVIAIVIAAVTFFRRGEPVTIQGVTDSLEAAIPLAREMAEVASTGVRASEQLYLTGKITKDERFTEAVRYFKTWFPDLDEDAVIKNIEAAVFLMDQAADKLSGSKAHSI